MRSFLFITAFVLASALSIPASANGPWNRLFQDQKYPTQVATEHQLWANVTSGASSYIKSGAALTSGAATTISTFTKQPDYARNITLTPTGTTASVQVGTAVVSGLNIFGKAITENFAISAGQSTATTGSKAFASLSSVSFPAASQTGATLSIGVGTKLGVLRCMKNAGDYDFSEYGGVYETTRGTIAANATVIESNTFTPTGTMDQAHDIDLFYIQNFRCYPGQ